MDIYALACIIVLKNFKVSFVSAHVVYNNNLIITVTKDSDSQTAHVYTSITWETAQQIYYGCIIIVIMYMYIDLCQ